MAEENVPGGRASMDPSARSRISEREGSSMPSGVASSNVPYEIHFQGPTPQQQLPGGHIFPPPGQQNVGYQVGRGSSGAFDMSGVAGALPGYQNSSPSQISHHDQQRYLTGSSSTNPGYQAQQIGGQPHMSNQAYPIHPSQYSPAYQQSYGQVQPNAQMQSTGPNSNPSSYPPGTFFAPQQQYMYYSGQYPQSGQSHGSPYSQNYSSGASQLYGQSTGDMSSMNARIMHSGYSSGTAMPYGSTGGYLRPGIFQGSSRGSSNSSSGSIPSTPRGPPRKPKQSGHALWVGNLPSGTVVSDLKDHFSRDATQDIESVFLISKSNCAFVNYRTEAACAAAMNRFHDSRFQGVRLVCRLRRSSNATPSPGIGAPAGPAALMPSVAYPQTAFEAITQNREISSKAMEDAAAETLRTGESDAKITDKYFIMKSLTVEDMELSVRNGIWATQSHNEDALNKAYEISENVFLIFSANKSGEYFGVARMTSPINEEAAADLDWAPRGETIIDDPDIPRSIPTPATEFAPRGHIIDDSARGTIFWEADPEDEELSHVIDQEGDDPEEKVERDEKVEEKEEEEAILSSEAQAFGKPFKIEWLSTNRLPFYRTRGLRNPWNANREVKIARDGTELETSVGRRLAQMFQKPTVVEGQQPPLGWPQGRPF